MNKIIKLDEGLHLKSVETFSWILKIKRNKNWKINTYHNKVQNLQIANKIRSINGIMTEIVVMIAIMHSFKSKRQDFKIVKLVKLYSLFKLNNGKN